MVLMRLQLSRKLVVLISHSAVMFGSDETVVGSHRVVLMRLSMGRHVWF